MRRQRDDQSLEIDPLLNRATLHERVERLAVPTFDWLSTPVEAITEGLTRRSHAGPAREPARGDERQSDGPLPDSSWPRRMTAEG
jgi:hypothetical protein